MGDMSLRRGGLARSECSRGRALIPDRRVAEVVGRLTGVPVDRLTCYIPSGLPGFDSADSLDTIELTMELEEEFGEETVRWALRFIEALDERSNSARRAEPGIGPGPDDPDPLGDRPLDG
jgi:hypothetical protein